MKDNKSNDTPKDTLKTGSPPELRGTERLCLLGCDMLSGNLLHPGGAVVTILGRGKYTMGRFNAKGDSGLSLGFCTVNFFYHRTTSVLVLLEGWKKGTVVARGEE